MALCGVAFCRYHRDILGLDVLLVRNGVHFHRYGYCYLQEGKAGQWGWGGKRRGRWEHHRWDLRFLLDPTGEYGPFSFASRFLLPRVEEILIWELELPLRPAALVEVMVPTLADGAAVIFKSIDLGCEGEAR